MPDRRLQSYTQEETCKLHYFQNTIGRGDMIPMNHLVHQQRIVAEKVTYTIVCTIICTAQVPYSKGNQLLDHRYDRDELRCRKF